MSSDKPSPGKAAASHEFACALRDAESLLGTTEPLKQTHRDLRSVLESRLSFYYSSRNQEWPQNLLELKDPMLLTACEALSVVERAQKLLAIEDDSVVPDIGTRDLGRIRTLLSLVFKWGVEPLLGHVNEAWPRASSNTSSEPTSSSLRTIDTARMHDEYKLLSQMTLRLLELIFPDGVRGNFPRSLVTTTLLSRHLTDILQPAFALGWLPRPLSTEAMPTIDALRPLVMRLLTSLPTSQSISSLGSIISLSPLPPLHVFRACTTLLSRQLLRPDGVHGFFAAVFGEEEAGGAGAAMEKLEHTSSVLNAVPANEKSQDYFERIIPQIIALLTEKWSPIYRRAAAFTISRMLSPDSSPTLHPVKEKIIFRLLHDPFLVQRDSEAQDLRSSERHPATAIHLRPDVALDVLLALLSNGDPSPSFISDLLSPIVPALYSLLYHLNKVKTSDPRLKDSLHGILLTWGKIVTTDKGITTLWSIVQAGQKGGWTVGPEGHIYLFSEPEPLSSLSFLMPNQAPKAVNLDDPDFDANIFNLYPDPFHFTKLLQEMGRDDISSHLFVILLENYRDERSQAGSDSLRILLYLQIIMQMQKQIAEGTTFNILKQPRQILSFIHHVLESTTLPSTSSETQHTIGLTLKEKLKIIPHIAQAAEVTEEENDSDDEMPDSETMLPDNELIETATSLLLSVLEADEDLSARTMPILNDIFSLLEPLSRGGNSVIRPLAHEARLVMTARLASSSQPPKFSQRSTEEVTAQETYQKALKLLQDPILPVRAHGLLLLRQLMTSPGSGQLGIRALDPALTPAILSIFLQSLRDEDSYIFLNAVQGLVAMADTFGQEVLRELMNEYTGNLEGLGASALTQQEVDARTRVGEALATVIRKSGEALGIHIDILVPRLFKLVRTRDIPTTLRTSALSLLADCINTYPLVMLVYIEELAGATIDLLQIESLPIEQKPPRQHKSRGSPDDAGQPNEEAKGEKAPGGTERSNRGTATEGDEKVETMDNNPTSTNSKLPPLRRAALHFLGLLIKEATRHAYESPTQDIFLTQAMVSRATVTLGYIASMDGDNVVRVMAKEAKEGLHDLQRVRMGI